MYNPFLGFEGINLIDFLIDISDFKLRGSEVKLANIAKLVNNIAIVQYCY